VQLIHRATGATCANTVARGERVCVW